MPYLFSPLKLAFFHTDVPCGDLPVGAIVVSDEEHESIMKGLLLQGKVLQAGEDGAPQAVERLEEPTAGSVPNSTQV